MFVQVPISVYFAWSLLDNFEVSFSKLYSSHSHFLIQNYPRPLHFRNWVVGSNQANIAG
jgi:hypothetical protein